MENEDRWDRIYLALEDAETYHYLREHNFIDENGLTETGKDLLKKMKRIYEII